MILYVLKQNKNSKSAAFGKWFAFPVIEETIDLDALAEHMSNHNTPYYNGGAASEEVFSVSKNIKGVKLRARATGELIAKNLNLEATLKKASATTTKTSGNGGGSTTPTNTGNDTGDESNTGGSQNQGDSGSIVDGSDEG